MPDVILHAMPDGRIACTFPTGEVATLDVAARIVPAGVPFVVVQSEELPPLDTQFAWEVDFSAPDGHGIGQDAWFAEQQEMQAAALLAAIAEQEALEAEQAQQAREAEQ